MVQVADQKPSLESRTPEPSNPRMPSRALLSCIPPLITTMGIGGSKPPPPPRTYGCSLLYTATNTSVFTSLVVTGVCPSPESRMPMTPSGRGTTWCF